MARGRRPHIAGGLSRRRWRLLAAAPLRPASVAGDSGGHSSRGKPPPPPPLKHPPAPSRLSHQSVATALTRRTRRVWRRGRRRMGRATGSSGGCSRTLMASFLRRIAGPAPGLVDEIQEPGLRCGWVLGHQNRIEPVKHRCSIGEYIEQLFSSALAPTQLVFALPSLLPRNKIEIQSLHGYHYRRDMKAPLWPWRSTGSDGNMFFFASRTPWPNVFRRPHW